MEFENARTSITAVAGGMRRRGQSRGDATRIQILSAAEALFAEHGRDATTTEKVAQRAGVSPGLLFYYFPTKDELFTTVIEERSALEVLKVVLPITLHAAQRHKPRATLTVLGIEFVRVLRARDRAVRILLRELAVDERAARQFRLLRSYASELIAQYLHQLMAPTTVPVDHAARMFVSDLMFACATDGAFDPECLVRAAVRVLFEGRVADDAAA
jgi:AcrR family transcriptional regulator